MKEPAPGMRGGGVRGEHPSLPDSFSRALRWAVKSPWGAGLSIHLAFLEACVYRHSFSVQERVELTPCLAQTGLRFLIVLPLKMLKFTRQSASFSLPLPPPFCLMYTFISTVSCPIENRNQETRDPWPLSGPTSRSPALYVAQPPQLALLDPDSVPCRLLQSPFYAGSHLALTDYLILTPAL